MCVYASLYLFQVDLNGEESRAPQCVGLPVDLEGTLHVTEVGVVTDGHFVRLRK